MIHLSYLPASLLMLLLLRSSLVSLAPLIPFGMAMLRKQLALHSCSRLVNEGACYVAASHLKIS